MKLKTIWSLEAIYEFEAICEYWDKRNNSNLYSRKLFKLTQEVIKIIEKHPKLGVNSNSANIKMRLVENNYYLIYKICDEHIEILKFWDTRQNPKKRKF
ncbi:type II toxin-antitoxin system RelE/ParE family toxin [Cyclobacterium sp. 1_MG-2023]|nr:type II toxin-antitoxin system RelE/ParE family toxin [Cyclobacterium sp. 1_MG-2023]MDO6435849.1 type II toxin-antitoxin system RelE/ParE family toxin [Cyclobacterium sp. 1_MG-2023]